MRITLNLATRPYADIRPALKRLRIAMAVLAVVAIGLVLGLRAFHQKAEVARATEQRVQNRIDAINRERQGYQNLMQEPANRKLLDQAGELNQLFDEKTFSWTLAMEDLETVLPGGVQVTAIDPNRDSKTGKIILKLRVVGPRDKADDLIQNLEHSRYFLAPHIVNESTETNGGPNERLEPVSASNRFTFELLAEYNSAAPPIKEKKTEKAAGDESANQDKPSPHANRKPGASGAKQAQPPPGAAKLPKPSAALDLNRPITPTPAPVRNFNSSMAPRRNPNPAPTRNPNPGGPR